MPKLYGIKNCDTVVKARKWLEAHNVAYDFMDIRSEVGALQLEEVSTWLELLGDDWPKLVNKRSTSWKALSEEQRSQLSEATAAQLLIDNPTLMKRPVLIEDTSKKPHMGFQADAYEALFA